MIFANQFNNDGSKSEEKVRSPEEKEERPNGGAGQLTKFKTQTVQRVANIKRD